MVAKKIKQQRRKVKQNNNDKQKDDNGVINVSKKFIEKQYKELVYVFVFIFFIFFFIHRDEIIMSSNIR